MKKVSTIAKFSTIVKIIARDSPEVFKLACEKSEPLLTNIALIPEIHSSIKEQFPDIDRTDESIMFAACVYHAYAPAALERSDLERAPNGIRQQMCAVMQWKDAPTVNYYAGIASAYFKGRAFKERVSTVLSGFEKFSVRNSEIELFLGQNKEENHGIADVVRETIADHNGKP